MRHAIRKMLWMVVDSPATGETKEWFMFQLLEEFKEEFVEVLKSEAKQTVSKGSATYMWFPIPDNLAMWIATSTESPHPLIGVNPIKELEDYANSIE